MKLVVCKLALFLKKTCVQNSILKVSCVWLCLALTSLQRYDHIILLGFFQFFVMSEKYFANISCLTLFGIVILVYSESHKLGTFLVTVTFGHVTQFMLPQSL